MQVVQPLLVPKLVPEHQPQLTNNIIYWHNISLVSGKTNSINLGGVYLGLGSIQQ
jgi:hypothetical protein